MINSMTFEFGNNEGQYPITGFITDSIFETGIVTGIAYQTQYYSVNFTQAGRSLNYNNFFTPIPGDKVKVDFLHPINICNA